MLSSSSGQTGLDSITDLPDKFISILKQSDHVRREENPAKTTSSPQGQSGWSDANIHTFYDLYTRIKKFKEDFPKLKLGFLDDENIAVLKALAEEYLNINDYLPLEEKKIVNRYNGIQNRHKENKSFEQTTFRKNTDTKEIKEAQRLIGHVQTIYKYKKVIDELNHRDEKDDLFKKLKALAQNSTPIEQEGIESIEAAWKRRSHLAFLSSASLRDVATILDQFSQYIEMITSEFVENQAYSEKFYEYLRGVSEENKITFKKMLEKARQILAVERSKLIQMNEKKITLFIKEINRVLKPSSHLFL